MISSQVLENNPDISNIHSFNDKQIKKIERWIRFSISITSTNGTIVIIA